MVEESYAFLKTASIDTVLSLPLREPHVPRGELAGRCYPEYSAEEEARLCLRVGLHFLHVPCVDHMPPSPDEVASALMAMDGEVDAGRTLYVHCRAGIGRTGVITGAWLMSRGWSGDEAGELYVRFCDHTRERWGYGPEMRLHYFEQAGLTREWWGLGLIARALGERITVEYSFVPPQRPEGADEWEELYWERLRPWRERRRTTSTVDSDGRDWRET